MSSSAIAPIIAGLAVGVAFVVLFAIFADKVPIDATWEYDELESIVTIPLEAGSRTIEIVSSTMIV